MVWIADHDVVQKLYLEKLSRSNEVTGDFDVGLGRCRFTARMIVRDDDCRGACHYCQTEYFPGMAENCVHCAYGHQILTLDAPTSVEDENHQAFTFGIEVRMGRYMRSPIGGCLIRSFALLHGVGCRTFPK